ncbi:MAG: hypothetical protein E6248_07565 [Clostridium sp.]|uniref:hypothetical protein n=1 Tax=Clostridium sp. TaxID=1506 RepID=UPI002906A140|nr:hypothetical protein [Clostridium sp.]MDU5110290.1 hypothetical protein [Clostridium sp.]
MEEKDIIIKNSIGVGQQRQLLELTRELARTLTEEEFLKIVSVYNSVVNRLIKQAEEEGIEI